MPSHAYQVCYTQHQADACCVCSPETGRKLRFGPAMTARMATVELPLVTALFADISAAGPKRQRAWTAAAPQPAVRRPTTMPTRHAVHVPRHCNNYNAAGYPQHILCAVTLGVGVQLCGSPL